MRAYFILKDYIGYTLASTVHSGEYSHSLDVTVSLEGLFDVCLGSILIEVRKVEFSTIIHGTLPCFLLPWIRDSG